MPLTRAGISVNPPTRSAPIDLAASFRMNGAGGAAMPSSGWATGAAANFITLPAGRTQGLWMIQVYSAFISTNQTYQFYLHGSNDPAFGGWRSATCFPACSDIMLATAALRTSSACRAGYGKYPGASRAEPRRRSTRSRLATIATSSR